MKFAFLTTSFKNIIFVLTCSVKKNLKINFNLQRERSLALERRTSHFWPKQNRIITFLQLLTPTLITLFNSTLYTGLGQVKIDRYWDNCFVMVGVGVEWWREEGREIQPKFWKPFISGRFSPLQSKFKKKMCNKTELFGLTLNNKDFFR